MSEWITINIVGLVAVKNIGFTLNASALNGAMGF